MIILLFGGPNVGKNVTGKLLAERLSYEFYNIDDEIKKHLNITLEKFVSTGTLYERDMIRCELINSLVSKKENKVIAVSPLSYIDTIQPVFSSPDILTIELVDSVENIFDRIIFSDENDIIYKNDDYKNEHKAHYLSEIKKNLEWYGYVNRAVKEHFNMDGRIPEDVVDGLISQYDLMKLKT